MFDLAPSTLHLAPRTFVCSGVYSRYKGDGQVSIRKLKGESAGGAGLTDTPS